MVFWYSAMIAFYSILWSQYYQICAGYSSALGLEFPQTLRRIDAILSIDLQSACWRWVIYIILSTLAEKPELYRVVFSVDKTEAPLTLRSNYIAVKKLTKNNISNIYFIF